MSAVPADLKYTKDHEWLKMESDTVAVIGITDFAQGELGDLVYLEVETEGETLPRDEVFGTVEAVKTTADLFMPVSGTVSEVNSALTEDGDDEPTLINTDPYGKGWIIKIEVSDLSELDELMDADAYKAEIGN